MRHTVGRQPDSPTLAAKTGFAGKALTAARTVPDARYHDSPAVTTGFSVGDRIQVSFVIQVENSEVGRGEASFTVVYNGASGNATKLALIAADVGPSICTAEFTVPSGCTGFYIKGPYVAIGPVTASIGQITFRNLTTLGIVAP
jgi:hypothetical protein